MGKNNKSNLGKLNKKHFRVAIFGSARIKKNDHIYKQVHALAKELGEREIDVVTGGGPGLMAAANAGHKVGGKGNKAHSIGLGIKLPMEQGFTKSIDKMETFSRFTSRLDKFMLLSNAVIVTPGGIGTLLELLYTWQLIQVEHICHIPIILLGYQYEGFVEWIERGPLKAKYLDRKDMHSLFLARNNNQVLKVVDKAHSEFKQGKKNFCLNYKRYRVD